MFRRREALWRPECISVGSATNPRILTDRVRTHSRGQKTFGSVCPANVLPIHYLWYTHKNGGIIYFAANDEEAELANIDRGSLMGGQMASPRSAVQTLNFNFGLKFEGEFMDTRRGSSMTLWV